MNEIGTGTKRFRDAIERHLRYSLGEDWKRVGRHDLFMAVSLAVRDLLIDAMLSTEARYDAADAKRLHYLSLEFLIGRSLGHNFVSLGLAESGSEVLREFGIDFAELRETEPDAALGNGGLGRLAACFLDSLATLGFPGYGYGINYDYGLFKQVIEQGSQREKPDNWRRLGTPWLIERADEACIVPVYGRVAQEAGAGGTRSAWVDWKPLVGVPHDMPIVGYGGSTVNTLRLYSARASDEFDMQIFNQEDYLRAVQHHMAPEAISMVLYPPATSDAGKELRLLQEYFFVACALRDIVSRHRRRHASIEGFADKAAIQLNDTHPALAVAELMRILLDDDGLPWELAWDVTRRVFGYTNHTLLPEALEKWPLPLVAHVLPRHVQIIERIDSAFAAEIRTRWPEDDDRLRRTSIIEEGHPRQLRMAHLAIVGSHSVNGVARLHSELIKTTLVPDFHELWPERFNNKTNGITPRRWLLQANPGLSELVSSRIGADWIVDLDRIRALEFHAEDPGFRGEFRAVKRANKEKLAALVQDGVGVALDPDSLFDIHVKRIHEYKRQLLAAMHVIHLYLSIVDDGVVPAAPRTVLFGGKAAPDYFMAKLIIKLINHVAEVVNSDPAVNGLLRVAFLPDYRVSLAERIIPAADLSEQISTAGKEASGTGNMKFALNGALTIGTLDGANIEIRDAVGPENIYIFGLHAHEVQELAKTGAYDPWSYYHRSALVRRVMDAIGSDRFSPREPGVFRPIWQRVLEHGDEYFHLADLESYVETQERAARDFCDAEEWMRRAVLNVSRVGRFSSDRTIREYAAEIWGLAPLR